MRGLTRWMVVLSIVGLAVMNLDRQPLPGDTERPAGGLVRAMPEPAVLGGASPASRPLTANQLAASGPASIGDAFWLGVVLAFVVMLMVVYLRWAVFEPGRRGG